MRDRFAEVFVWFLGAGDRTRTGDILLGKQTLYQLSYTRVGRAGSIPSTPDEMTRPGPLNTRTIQRPRPDSLRSPVLPPARLLPAEIAHPPQLADGPTLSRQDPNRQPLPSAR